MKMVIRKQRGKFGADLFYRDEETNKRCYKRMSLHETREEAEIACEKFQMKLDMGFDLYNETEGKEIRLNQCIEESIEKSYKRKAISYNTYQSYMKTFEKHIKKDIGMVLIKKLTTKRLQDFIDKHAETKAKSTMNIFKSVLKKGVEYALQCNYINRDLMTGVKIWGTKASSSSATDHLTKEQVADILKRTEGTELGMQIMIAVNLGIRESELLALDWRNIDLENGAITIKQTVIRKQSGEVVIQNNTKNGEELIVSIPKNLLAKLKEYKLEWNKERLKSTRNANHQLLFTNSKLEPYAGQVLYGRFKREMTRMGYEGITFHGLRHTYATFLFESGMDLKKVSMLLNHKTVATTEQVYVHMTKALNTEATEAIDTVFENII